MPSGTEAPIKAFASATEWEQWLAEHHQTEPRLWLQIAKKTSGISTVTYDEALDVALCHGWIDGQRKSYDGDYFLQKFSPRRPGSLWSKRNVAKVSKLIEASRMRHAGFVEVDAAQQDGRWQAAYDSQRTMAIPEDFMSALGLQRIGADFGLQRSRWVRSLPMMRMVVARQRAACRCRARRSVLRRSWP